MTPISHRVQLEKVKQRHSFSLRKMFKRSRAIPPLYICVTSLSSHPPHPHTVRHFTGHRLTSDYDFLLLNRYTCTGTTSEHSILVPTHACMHACVYLCILYIHTYVYTLCICVVCTVLFRRISFTQHTHTHTHTHTHLCYNN